VLRTGAFKASAILLALMGETGHHKSIADGHHFGYFIRHPYFQAPHVDDHA
jgi:hypothetical protein